MDTRVEALRDDVSARAKSALAELDAGGVPYAVTFTLRTQAEQIALFAQGRETLEMVNAKRYKAQMPPITEADNAYTVTQCDGINNYSPHQQGRAIDVVPSENGSPVWPDHADPRWQQISAPFKEWGFKWGGDWTDFPDFPHYEIDT